VIQCDSGPTLAALEDDDPPPSLAERAGPKAVAAVERLFAGDFSADDHAAVAMSYAWQPRQSAAPAGQRSS
jgi:hypothetical protein